MTRQLVLPAIFVFATASLVVAAEPPYTVDRGDIIQMVRERGALDAASAIDIVASAGGSKEKPLVIKWLIEDGSHVKKGERLIEFDDGFLREQLAALQLTIEQANAVTTMAERDLAIARRTSAKELRSTEAAVEVAELTLKNSTESHLLAKKRLELRVKLADVALAKAELTLKGENTEAAKLGVQTAAIEREAAELEMKQFDLSVAPARRQMELRIREAKDEIELAKLRAEQRLTQVQASTQAAKAGLAQEKARLDAMTREVANCVITAPAEGIVVYWVAPNGGRGPVVAVGEPVREGQKLLRIPDLSRMKVETRVHESQVSQLRPGQVAHVRVDALPNQQLTARVDAISPVASSDWRNRDVKVYPVNVGLPKLDARLKPGMTADVQIHIASAKNVLRVPITAVIGTGRKATCAVDTPAGVRETNVVTGISDGRFIEIKDGLKEGDKVLIPVKP